VKITFSNVPKASTTQKPVGSPGTVRGMEEQTEGWFGVILGKVRLG